MSQENREIPDGGRPAIPVAGGEIALDDLGYVDSDGLEDIRERLQWMENKTEGARSISRDAVQRVNELEQLVERQTDRIHDVIQQYQELEERTQLLQAINRASSLKKHQRVAVLIQTIYNKAKRHEREDDTPTASADINTYEDALGGDCEPTYFYRDAKAAVNLVGDEDVLKFVQESPGARKNSRLILDLQEGHLPSVIAGHDTGSGGNQWKA